MRSLSNLNQNRASIASVVAVALILTILPFAKVTAQAWCEDFEDQTISEAPSGWVLSGNTGTIVVDDFAFSGAKSVKTFGTLGGCWAGLAAKPLSIEFPFAISAKVRNGDEDLYGCHPSRAWMRLWSGSTWTEPGLPGAMSFLENGDFWIELGGGSIAFPGLALNQWHSVRIEYDTVTAGLLAVKYWVNGEYLGEYTAHYDASLDPNYLAIGSQEGTAWFDDICIERLDSYCEDWEQYAAGSLPTLPWANNHADGPAFVRIVDTVAYTGTRSSQYYGDPRGYNGAISYLSLGSQLPVEVSFALKNGAEDVTGNTRIKGNVWINSDTIPSSPTVAQNLIAFKNNAELWLNLTDLNNAALKLPGYNSHDWYFFRITLEQASDGTDSIDVDYYVNNQYLSSLRLENLFDPDQIFLSISCAEKYAWYDDICVTQGTSVQTVFVDIKPGSCPNPFNLTAGKDADIFARDNTTVSGTGVIDLEDLTKGRGSKGGVLPVAILGTADVDVTQIDPESIELEGVPIVRWSIEDVSTPVDDTDPDHCLCSTDGPDGYPDMTLKFYRNEIAQVLGDVEDGETITLTLTGELFDGTPIEGTDCIEIVGGGKPTDDVPETDLQLANYPNPFNPTTTISFALPTAQHVKLEIINMLGQRVDVLVDKNLAAGSHQIVWDASGVASGVYFYRLITEATTETKRMLLVK